MAGVRQHGDVKGVRRQWPERFSVLKTLLFLFTFFCVCVCVSIRNTYKNASGISLVCDWLDFMIGIFILYFIRLKFYSNQCKQQSHFRNRTNGTLAVKHLQIFFYSPRNGKVTMHGATRERTQPPGGCLRVFNSKPKPQNKLQRWSQTPSIGLRYPSFNHCCI